MKLTTEIVDHIMFFDYKKNLLIWRTREPLDGVISKGDAYMFNKYNRGGTPVGGRKAESRNMNTSISVMGKKVPYGKLLDLLGVDAVSSRTAGRGSVIPVDGEEVYVAMLDGEELQTVSERWMAEAIIDAAINRGM